ncbi:MAG: Uncharacterized protein CEN90_707 [Parcubacteria group bacterium Licking1014_17]|nr:MAG: Uncharacterized protein CEN90_707 [Parcubacteria group bacterium Licking1014_17]
MNRCNPKSCILYLIIASLFCSLLIIGTANASLINDVARIILSVRTVRVEQKLFRFYSPTSNLTPYDMWPPANYDIAESTNISESSFPPLYGSTARLRIGLKISNVDLPEGSRQYKIQFAKLSSGTCSDISSWTYLGDPDSAAAWRGFDISPLADGATITDNLLTGASVKGTYEESNSTGLNPAASVDDIIEYDWSIQNNISSPDGATYCFRMVNNDGTALDTYTKYPQIISPLLEEASATGEIDVATGGNLVLTNPDSSKLTATIPANYLAASHSFGIYSFDYNDYLDRIGSQPVGKSGANSHIYRLVAEKDKIASHSFQQPIDLQIKYLDSDVSSLEEDSLQIYKYNNGSWSALSTVVDMDANTATAETSDFSSFGLFGTVKTPTPTPTATATSTPTPTATLGGGGGGGGGGGANQTATVIIRGRAYPDAEVTFVRDAQFIAKVKADSLGYFEARESNLTGGGYNFSLWAVDKSGVKSNAYTFYADIPAGAIIQFMNVLIPPTISIGSETIKPGENLKVFGSSVPESYVVIELRSEPSIFTTIAALTGSYSKYVSSQGLSQGSHSVKSKSKVSSGDESNFSNILTFGIGTPPAKKYLIGDLNKDGHVNIVDFSILAFWYKRFGFPLDYDLNSDGKIDLKDFSIMAFHWTG